MKSIQNNDHMVLSSIEYSIQTSGVWFFPFFACDVVIIIFDIAFTHPSGVKLMLNNGLASFKETTLDKHAALEAVQFDAANGDATDRHRCAICCSC